MKALSSTLTALPAAGSVYLTFDDGPDENWTPRVLDLLAEQSLQATFFIVGRFAIEHPELVRRIASHGHAVGNHTWSHRHPWAVSAAVARQEVRAGTQAIADIIGKAPVFFRPPHGRLRRCMLEEIEREGQTLVLWDRSAVDWGPFGLADKILRRLDAVQDGDIVLMHDSGRGINRPDELVKVLPTFLASLKPD